MSSTTALQRLRDAGVRPFSARDLVSRLTRALTSTRKRRQDETRGHAETALLSALAEEGCPVCRTNAGHDDRTSSGSCTRIIRRSRLSRC
jgi:hypothetical protein